MWSDQSREAAIAARAKSGAKPTNLIGQGAVRGGTSAIKNYFSQQGQQYGQFQDRRGASETPVRNVASNQAAAEALMAGVKYGAVPVHDSMAGQASNPTTAPSPQNRSVGDGVMKGERTPGNMINSELIANMRFNNFGKRGT